MLGQLLLVIYSATASEGQKFSSKMLRLREAFLSYHAVEIIHHRPLELLQRSTLSSHKYSHS